jgi:hypothetical protein
MRVCKSCGARDWVDESIMANGYCSLCWLNEQDKIDEYLDDLAWFAEYKASLS